MECSMSGIPVHHQLPEFTQTHVHWVGDAILTISSSFVPFSSCLQSFPASGSFQWVSSLHQVTKYWSFNFSISPSNEYSGLIFFSMDWLDLLAVQETFKSSPTVQFKSINSWVLSFLYDPIVTSIHDYWRRQWQPTPVLLPGKSHGRRSLVGCNPWGCEESDTTEQLHFHFSLSCIVEGSGNPLQCSCLENPRERGAWWAAAYGVAQSRTQLKWLSSIHDYMEKP